MRIYQSATIVEERLTGFQSPCSEFAEKPLSLDEHFSIGNPALHFVQVTGDALSFQIQKNDWLLLDLSRRPGPNSLVLVIVGEEMKIFRGLKGNVSEDATVAVVTAVLRDFRKGELNLNTQKEPEYFFD